MKQKINTDFDLGQKNLLKTLIPRSLLDKHLPTKESKSFRDMLEEIWQMSDKDLRNMRKTVL